MPRFLIAVIGVLLWVMMEPTPTAPAQGFSEAPLGGDVVLPPAPPSSSGSSGGPALMVGPTVGVQLPQVWDVSLDMRLFGALGFGVGGGFTPKMKLPQLLGPYLPGSHVAISHVEARLGWFPWAESFFIGFLVGHQKWKTWNSLSLTSWGVAVPVESHMELSTTYVTPHFGWQKIFPSGFVVGWELGVQLPLDANPPHTFSVSGPPSLPPTLLYQTESYKKAKKNIDNTIKLFGQTPVPYWKILKVGVLI